MPKGYYKAHVKSGNSYFLPSKKSIDRLTVESVIILEVMSDTKCHWYLSSDACVTIVILPNIAQCLQGWVHYLPRQPITEKTAQQDKIVQESIGRIAPK